jgi:acetyl-CoA carboxylase biotin carboxyl carrier protein
MDLQYLKKLLKIFDDSTAEDLEIEEKGIKLKISKNKEDKISGNAPIFNLSGALPSNQNYQPQQQQVQTAPVPQPQAATAEPNVETTTSFHEIKAPMVGTYYGAPSPDSEDFVKVGQRISKGQTLCIVEAMKLMNEIESDIDGEIVKILTNDTEAVEYNQVLFHIKPN